MSISWDIGFIKKPKIEELDEFMQSWGYKIEKPNQRKSSFSRIYAILEPLVPRDIELFYSEEEIDNEIFKEKKVESYGSLTTYSVKPNHLKIKERLKTIEEKRIKNQHDYYKHLSPERLKWYETALAIKNKFNCMILSEQTGEEINPNKAFQGFY
jgi:hypothetical protein